MISLLSYIYLSLLFIFIFGLIIVLYMRNDDLKHDINILYRKQSEYNKQILENEKQKHKNWGDDKLAFDPNYTTFIVTRIKDAEELVFSQYELKNNAQQVLGILYGEATAKTIQDLLNRPRK